MGQMKRAQLKLQRMREAKERLVDFLAKTGNKAAQDYVAGVPSEDLLDAMKYAINSFGRPDTLIVSPDTMRQLNRQFGSKK